MTRRQRRRTSPGICTGSSSTWVDDDGMVVIRGRLTPEVGAVVQRALEAAADRLFQEAQGMPKAERLTEEVTPAQRRADALGLLAEVALTSDLDRGSAGDRYQVVLHVEASDRCGGRGRSVRAPWRWTTARWTFPRNLPCSVAAPRRPETDIRCGVAAYVGYVSGAVSPARNLT